MGYKRLILATARLSSYVLSPVLRLIGRLVYHFRASNSPDSPVVFLIGPPRTGSTILYQALTNFGDVSYIDNLTCMCRDALFFGSWLSHVGFGDAPHDNFQSEHGATAQFGLHCPSECGSFWYRWFPRDPHFVEADDLTPRQLSALATEINRVVHYFGRPFLIKNLVCGQRLRVLAKVFPDAKIIVVERDTNEVVRSILKARKVRNVREGAWWSVKPRGYEAYIDCPEPEMAHAQIRLIKEVIEEDTALFRPENVRTVNYSDFDEDLVIDLLQWIGAPIKRRPSYVFHPR